MKICAEEIKRVWEVNSPLMDNLPTLKLLIPLLYPEVTQVWFAELVSQQ